MFHSVSLLSQAPLARVLCSTEHLVVRVVAPVVELYEDINQSIEIEPGNNLSLAVRITTFNYPLISIIWTFYDAKKDIRKLVY